MEMWLRKADDCKKFKEFYKKRRELALNIAKKCLSRQEELDEEEKRYRAIYWRWKHEQNDR